MKKSIKITLGVFLVIAFILAGSYAVGNQYFKDRFYANTHIGDVNVAGLTVEEAKPKVESEFLNTTIQLNENGEQVGQIQLDQVASSSDSDAILVASFNGQQESSNWVSSLTHEENLYGSFDSQLSFDDEKIQDQLNESGLSNSDREPAKNAELQPGENGFEIQEGEPGTQIDLDKLKSLMSQQATINLEDTYIEPEITSEDESLQASLDQANQILQTQLTLQIENNEVTIPQKKIQDWVSLSDNGEVEVDEEKIYDYLGELNQEYATYAKERPFQSTYSGEITIAPDKLGWHIDREAEMVQIAEDLKAGKDIKREPEIIGNHYGYGLDFGEDYIEVDMSAQKMMVYIGGEKVFETDVITGRPGSETIPGAKIVWDKQTPSVLRGYNVHLQESYATPVNYWIPIDDHAIGIHDADWQTDFGGDTYLTRGSLGCINTPPGVMGQVFELAYIGMPVAVF